MSNPIVVMAADCMGYIPMVTDPIDTTGADLIVLATIHVGFLPPANLTDTYNNTWSLVKEESNPNLATLRLLYCVNPIVGPGHSFSLDQNYSAIGYVIASGADNKTPFDQYTSNNLDDVTSISPGSLTPKLNGALLVAGMTNAVDNSITVDANYTMVIKKGSQSSSMGIAYLLQDLKAPVNPNFSWPTSFSATSIGADFNPVAPVVVPDKCFQHDYSAYELAGPVS